MTFEFKKRLLDLAVGVPAFFLCAPAIMAIGLMVTIRMGRPVFFRQMRPGLCGKPFRIYKFRTMTNACDKNGRLLPDSVRLTPLGKFLRSTSLDELPELFNVVKGDMSLVGPRPLLMRYSPYFSEEERERFLVQPGITGLAQISGRNDLPWDLRIAADLQYVRERSLGHDLRILLKTFSIVLRRKGMRVDPGSTMRSFDTERSVIK